MRAPEEIVYINEKDGKGQVEGGIVKAECGGQE